MSGKIKIIKRKVKNGVIYAVVDKNGLYVVFQNFFWALIERIYNCEIGYYYKITKKKFYENYEIDYENNKIE